MRCLLSPIAIWLLQLITEHREIDWADFSRNYASYSLLGLKPDGGEGYIYPSSYLFWVASNVSFRMSNSSLISRIEAAFILVNARRGASQLLAEAMRNNGRALENMPYQLIKDMESLAMDLDAATWHEDEGFLTELPTILSQVDAWLHKLPRDVT